MTLSRRPYDPSDAPALLAFCARHPACTYDAPMRERLLTRLASGPAAVVDLFSGERRAAVAVVVDTLDEPADAVITELLGAHPSLDWSSAGPLILEAAEAAARAAGRHRVDTSWLMPLAPALEAALQARGYVLAYRDCLMARALAPLPPAPPLPARLRWRVLDAALVPVYRRLIAEAFTDAGIPLHLTPEAELARALLAERPAPRLLFDGDEPVGFLRVSHAPGARTGEVAQIGRAPAHRGRGLGDHLMAEALRALVEDGAQAIELGVVARNARALALYRRFGFEVVSQGAVYRRSP